MFGANRDHLSCSASSFGASPSANPVSTEKSFDEVNQPHPFTGPTSKIAALLIAGVVALVAALALQPAAAGASSGGVSAADEQKAAEQTGTTNRDRRYARLWQRVSKRNKRWAHRVANCESGHNPRAIGGGGRYRGAFQFLRSTWRRTPRSPGGDPIRYPFKTQAVVAVSLKRNQGTSPWPNCG